MKRYTGFTLIETLVAVTILTFAVVGPMFTASRAIVAAQLANDQITASYLAQEGIEYVREVRDNAYLDAYQDDGPEVSTTAWGDFLASVSECNATTNSTRACTLDLGSGGASSLKQCSASPCAPLRLTQLSGGNYGYTQQNSGTVTPFTRTIQVIDVSSNDERIISTVSWSFHGIPYSVTINEHLMPWQ